MRHLLKDMVTDGQIVLSDRKTYRPADQLPEVMVLRIQDIDDYGDMIGTPDGWKGSGEPPRLIVVEGPASKKVRGHNPATLGIGERALCRIRRTDGGHIAQVMKKLQSGTRRHLGVLYQDGRGWKIRPVDRKYRDEARPVRVPANTNPDTLVEYQLAGRSRGYERRVDITRILGPADGPHAFSLISLEQHGIPIGFDDDLISEAQNLKPPGPDRFREDLRDLPLITIDPVDAGDFDDAIYAIPDDDLKNKNGWIIWVAIADVAAFVQPGSRLDRVARQRGNSVYLPDRVEPMLPHELSSGLCSLRPNEDRACMAVKMHYRADGSRISHEFKRGIMRSRARLTYTQAQEGFEGQPGEAAKPVMDILENVFRAYEVLKKARDRRQPLAIELPERRIDVNDMGEVTKITIRRRFDAHRLIEEFMVQANVAAAEVLDAKGVRTLARIHDAPMREKLQELSDFMPTIGLKWSAGDRVTTARFNDLLSRVRDTDYAEAVGLAVLRSQSQACYASEGCGHFGLNLSRYVHFTSPIRRYADLVVHRALIRTLGLGRDGTTQEEQARLKETGEHISDTERRAMAAERDTRDRYIARYLEQRTGAEFDACITGVTKAGLFVTLDETGADGFIPIRILSPDYFLFDDRRKTLVNVETGGTYRFGRKVRVRLKEATPVTGGLLFDMLSRPEKGEKPGRTLRGRNRTYRTRRSETWRK